MSSKVFLTVTSVAVVSLAAYAVWFDYKRRNDATFRKKLRKDKKKVDKTNAQSKEMESSRIGPEELRAALDKVRAEEVPKTPEEKEQYFMSQVGMGEQLSTQGPQYHLQAALFFYRALRVYPSPVELIVIYQKTVPEEIFKLVMEMTNLDVKNRVEGYYDAFPPKAMNVTVDTVDVPDGSGNLMRKKVLVATKDFDAGELIYKEHPAATALDFDLQGKGTHCTHCLRHIQKGMAITPASDRLESVYCSKDCQVKSKTQSQNLLFGLESPLPRELAPEMSSDSTKQRDAAQATYIEYVKKQGKIALLLVARFIARQVAVETAKMIPVGGTSLPLADVPEADGGDYTLYDHVERLRYLQVTTPEGEAALLAKVLATAVPGLEQFVTEERYATLLGKMTYNAFGVCFGDGRDDKPAPTERPEDVEKTRTPYGTQKQVGSGLYLVSAYAAHSCDPSARPSFSNGTSELHLIANRALKKGDDITVSYVDVTQHSNETLIEARRRRRMELARGWRFACSCTRCTSEAVENPASADGEIGRKDESKVEEAVTRIEASEVPSTSLT